MNALCAHQLQHIAVLGKQGHGRHRLVGQHAFEVLGQRKAGVFDFPDGVLAAMLRLLHELLHSRFHGAQHQHRPGQAHHLQRTHRLMELLAGNAQLAGVNGSQIGATRRFSVPGKTFEGFGCAVERLADLVKHPSQRAQVIHGEIGFGYC